MSDRWEDVRNVLVVALGEGALERVREVLAPPTVVLSVVAELATAHELLAQRRFDGVLVGFPMPAKPLAALLDAVRRRRSLCRSAAVVLLTPASLRHEASAYVGRGVNRVVALEEIEAALAGTLDRLCRVSPRVALKVIGRIEVVNGGSRCRFYCQTGNVSSSGMLLRIPPRYPPTTELSFELFLPGDLEPVRGSAQVVRHAYPPHEPFPGLGVAFTNLGEMDETRLRARLATLA